MASVESLAHSIGEVESRVITWESNLGLSSSAPAAPQQDEVVPHTRLASTVKVFFNFEKLALKQSNNQN